MYVIPNHFLPKILVILLSVILLSCSLSSDESSDKIDRVNALPLQETLKANVINVGPDIDFLNLRKVENVNDKYLVFIDDVNKGVFKVFSLPEAKFQYDWGRMGRGPDELSFVSLRQINSYKNNLILYEDVYARLRFYQVTDSTLTLSQERDDFSFSNKRNPINGLKILKDSLYIIEFGYGDLDNTKLQNEFIALKPGSQKPLFTFGKYPSLDLEPVKRMQEYSKVTAVKPDGSKLVSFYRRYNRFKIFDDEGKLLKEVNINDSYLSNDDDPGFIYRISAEATDKYIYALAVNTTEKALEEGLNESFKPSVEVWSWNGKPVQRFMLDYLIPRFTVSETYGKLYGYSLSLNNKIYEYDLKKIMKAK